MSLNTVDDRALELRLSIEQQVEAESSALADARSNTPSWFRIRQGDQAYIRHLVLELSALAHGKAIAIDWE